MTAFLPLGASMPLPPSPAFLVPSPDPASHMKRVIKAVLKARRIAVVCGAGISVQAGIPDFRSADGLFQTLKKDHPMLSSGKDLFDASVFNSEDTTSLFCQMIAQLSEMSEAAQPTMFHRFLRVMDERRRLLRVYTQNIDALEEKSGLTFGVPELDGKRYKPRSTKGKAAAIETPSTDTPPQNEASTSRLPSPPVETPRCIPLHGTLQSMHCQTCTHSYPLRNYIGSLSSGTPPPCPQCTSLEETRQLIGKRSRGVGRLRPSVVLYNEDHKDGEEVGNVVRKDLMGSSKGKGRAGADLLLVVGTSLRVPGTKRIVREFSKAVRSRHAAMNAPADEQPTTSTTATTSHGLVTPTPSPRRSPAEDEESPVRTIYLNLDFPVPTREWEGVFDVWIRGDAQAFAGMVHEELEREQRAKEAVKERRRKREEAAADMAKLAEEREREGPQQTTGQSQVRTQTQEGKEGGKKGKKRKNMGQLEDGREGQMQEAKKRKTGIPPHSSIPPSSNAAEKKRDKEWSKKPNSKRKHEATALPTPPVSRDDSSRRLVIKVPPRPKLMPEVVIPILPKPIYPVQERALFSSPLSSPPLSNRASPPTLTKTTSGNTGLSSPLSTPPLSSYVDSPYNMSRLSKTLSQISSPLSSPPLSTRIPSPPKATRTISGTTQLSSPLSSPPPSPYRQEPSPPPSPSPASNKKRKTTNSNGGSLVGVWLGSRPGTRQAQKYDLPRFGEDDYVDVVGNDDGISPPSESRLPESYVRADPGQMSRRRLVR